MEFGHKIRHEWLLDTKIDFLNHGSFGAVPKKVLAAVNRYTEQLEREPAKFFIEDYPLLIRETANKLANFFGTKGDNLVFVENATTGVNTVLRSLQQLFKPGDELLTVNHVYPGVRNAMQYIAEVTGAKYIEIDIPFPVESKEQIIDLVSRNINPKTKFALFDHISSPTAIIFPVKELAGICRQNSTYCLIDGAHAPGMLDLNIEEINADWYVGNCHKWLFAPKSCAILWSADKSKDLLHPLSISLEYKEGYTAEFDWTGTKNPAPFLASGDALDFYLNLSKDEIISYIHKLAVEARQMLATELSLIIPSPDDMHGSMASLEYPIKNKIINKNTFHELRKYYFNKYQIEVPFMQFDKKVLFRISAQVYNELQDYEKLAYAIKKEMLK